MSIRRRAVSSGGDSGRNYIILAEIAQMHKVLYYTLSLLESVWFSIPSGRELQRSNIHSNIHHRNMLSNVKLIRQKHLRHVI